MHISLAGLLKIVLGAMLCLAVLWCVAWWRAGGPWVAGLGVVVLLLPHVPLLAVEALLARWHNRHDPAPPATLAESARAWWAESLGAVRVFGWEQPFCSQRYADRLPPSGSDRRGVVLIHGFVCNRGVWNAWQPRLQGQGVPTLALNLEPVFTSIDRYAAQIDAAVRQVTAATGKPPVLVAHSMGGLAVRAWLRLVEDDSRVHRVVTIGTPHRGTWLARFGIGLNAREMRAGSTWFGPLAGVELSTRQALFTCFYSHCDNIVFPCSNATLPNADNRHLRGHAHVHLIHHPAVLAEVLRLSLQ